MDRLLDVSTNADQWGIEIVAGANGFNFSGLILQAPAADTAVFTVPGISWEPVVSTTGVPAWLAASSPNDGTPTVFLVATTAPAAIVPVTTLEQYQAAAGSAQTRMAFTLSFGITADLNDSRTDPKASGPTYSSVNYISGSGPNWRTCPLDHGPTSIAARYDHAGHRSLRL